MSGQIFSKTLCVITTLVGLIACGEQVGTADSPSSPASQNAEKTNSTPASSSSSSSATHLYWGDTHLHTNLSPDAYVQKNTTATPDDAFRFAKGAPVIDANSRAKIKIETPLDFLVVTDHAEYTAIPKMIWEKDPRLIDTEIGKKYAKWIGEGKGRNVFYDLVKAVNTNTPNPILNNPEFRKTIWAESVEAADRHNKPGEFSAFIGWEWSSIPKGQNLHRIIFLPEGADVAKQFIPFNAFDSDIESDFWAWLEKTSASTGADFVAIPHNGNISNGLMFPMTDRTGQPISEAYAKTRMRWEPVIETTQIKGDSETHPSLSPDDDFADFETYEHLIKMDDSDMGDIADLRKGSYTRSGLMRGLELDQQLGVNPFKYGLIGATDSHTGYSSAEENNFWGKFSLDSIPDNKTDKELVPGVYGWDMSSSGLAAVWATENTRQSISDAFKRREVYGTSGPRIALRFFGGWGFSDQDANSKDIAAIGYKKGVSMGSDLSAAPSGLAPSFLIHAVKDPKDANLDRVQIVKSWLGDDGKAQEKVFNVAWSGSRKLDDDGRLTVVGNSVDLETGLYSNIIGSAQLSVAWVDPEFKTTQKAFYYVRVLQIPTPRNSTYDAIALGIAPNKTGKPVIIQERAYSSPIWYTP